MGDFVSDAPGLAQCFRDIFEGFFTYLKLAKYSNGDKFIENFNFNLLISDFYNDLSFYFKVSIFELVLSIILALFFTLTRCFLTIWIFKPFAAHLRLNDDNARKFPESLWKFLYYVLICSYLLRVVIFSQNSHYFYKPYEIWKDYFSVQDVPTEVGIAFLMEFSYYLHSIYGTLYMDLWRKDSPVMLFHHLLCLLLIGFSYAVRYHKVGLLLMFVHDFADVFLEFSKCQVYMKYRDGRYIVWHDVIATFSFAIFALAWFVGRLYLFPIIVIRSSSYSTMFNGPPQMLPFYFIFNILLGFMLALNIYWFILILKFLYKVSSGQLKDLDDIRDYDVDMKMKRKGGSDDYDVGSHGNDVGDHGNDVGDHGNDVSDYDNNVGGDHKAIRGGGGDDNDVGGDCKGGDDDNDVGGDYKGGGDDNDVRKIKKDYKTIKTIRKR